MGDRRHKWEHKRTRVTLWINDGDVEHSDCEAWDLFEALPFYAAHLAGLLDSESLPERERSIQWLRKLADNGVHEAALLLAELVRP